MQLTKPARSWQAITGAALAVANLLLGAPAQAANTHYAALGDSFSSGEGADDYYASAGSCLRSDKSFPVLWANSHVHGAFDFVACAGATTDVVRGTQLGVLNSATTLVTVSVGGNDIGFKDVVSTCRFSSTSACRSAVDAAVDTARTTLPAGLTATYSAIRAAAPQARLIVLGYPRLFETGTSCGLFGIGDAKRVALNNGTDALESVIRARAAAAGATFVSLQEPFTGHRVCSSQPWINGTVPLAIDSYHPNAEGYSLAYLPALAAVTG
jgi:lysophospholipase L1-like esterase